MWKTINRVLEKDVKISTVSSIEIDGKTLTKEHDVLDALICPFVSVGPKLAKSIETRQNDNCFKHITPVDNEMMLKQSTKRM